VNDLSKHAASDAADSGWTVLPGCGEHTEETVPAAFHCSAPAMVQAVRP
jgi:hypothetical protein